VKLRTAWIVIPPPEDAITDLDAIGMS